MAHSRPVLPDELSLNIFYRCRAEDFLRATQVCREWHRLCDDDTIWREIYRRQWRKDDSTMALRYQTRMRSSWQELYVERARIEKAFFGSPETPDELKHDELKQANVLFFEAKEQRYHSAEDPSAELQKLAFALVLLSIVGEKCESLSQVEPNSYVVFWNWGSALSTQALWTTQLLRTSPNEAQAKHTSWLYALSCEKSERALDLAPLNADGLANCLLYANFCAELGNKSDDESELYLEKARVYYRRALQRAQAVEQEQAAGAPTSEDVGAMARAHNGIGSTLLTAAEKLYESVANSRAEREHNGGKHNDGEEGSDDDREEAMERERQQVTRMLEMLREAREELLAAVRIHPNHASNLLPLCSALTLLGEMSEDNEEAEMYFEEGVVNFERATAIDADSVDEQNDYGILLTKRAQRIWKQLRNEGFDPTALLAPAQPEEDADAAAQPEDADAVAPEEEAIAEPDADADANPDAADADAGQAVAEEDVQASEPEPVERQSELPLEPVTQREMTEEEREAARRDARCSELVARASRYFDAAEAKFRMLYEAGVWFGAINLACLAALRGREPEAQRWLSECRDNGDLEPEHLADHDFDSIRDREWFHALRDQLVERQAARAREQQEQREAALAAAAAAAAAAQETPTPTAAEE